MDTAHCNNHDSDSRRSTRLASALGRLGLVVLLVSAPRMGCAWELDGVKAYKGIFRINTNISAGATSPEQVVEQARACGVKVLVFSDQFLVRGEWGLWPLRNLLKVARERPSVSTFGVQAYLDRLARLARANPDIIIVPGLDVAPCQFWTGSPLRGTLTVRQWSEQLTLAPVSAAEPLESMPVAANPKAQREWGAWSIAAMWPCLPIGLALAVWWRGAMRYRDEQGHTYRTMSPRAKWAGAGLFVVGAVFFANNFPFALPSPCDPYGEPTVAGYQHLLDWVGAHTSAMAFWSAPEAKVDDVVDGVRVRSEPYVDDVVSTRGATGFAAMYGDARTMHLPGRAWDAALLAYCRGERERPLWAVGERDYHGTGRLDLIQTVFLLREFTSECVIRDGLRGGRMYAVCVHRRDDALWLERFSADAAAGGTVRVRVVLKAVARRSRGSLEGVLVRNGQVIREESLEIPSQLGETTHTLAVDDTPPAIGRSYYRFMATGRLGEIVTNPLFVQVKAKDMAHG